MEIALPTQIDSNTTIVNCNTSSIIFTQCRNRSAGLPYRQVNQAKSLIGHHGYTAANQNE
jgi:hypothetical protein